MTDPTGKHPEGFEQQTINPGDKITKVLGRTHSVWVDGAPFTPVFLDATGKEIARVGPQRVLIKELRINPKNAESDCFSTWPAGQYEAHPPLPTTHALKP